MEKEPHENDSNDKPQPEGSRPHFAEEKGKEQEQNPNSSNNSSDTEKPQGKTKKTMSISEVIDSKDTWEVAKFILDLLMTAFTILLFLIATKQTKSANDSAKAAIDAVDLARKQFELNNRPFLTAKNIKNIDVGDGTVDFITATIVYSNVGNYPTKLLKHRTYCFLRPPNESKDGTLEKLKKGLSTANWQESPIQSYYLTKERDSELSVFFKDVNPNEAKKRMSDLKTYFEFAFETVYEDLLTQQLYKLTVCGEVRSETVGVNALGQFAGTTTGGVIYMDDRPYKP
jgi:hypothetical protein